MRTRAKVIMLMREASLVSFTRRGHDYGKPVTFAIKKKKKSSHKLSSFSWLLPYERVQYYRILWFFKTSQKSNTYVKFPDT